MPLDDLLDANRQIRNPRLINPGQQIQLPARAQRTPEPAPSPAGDRFDRAPVTGPRLLPVPNADNERRTVTVRTGDTMSGIADRNGVTLQQLIAANPQVRRPSLIFAGQVLNLPEGTEQGPRATPRPVVDAPAPREPRTSTNPYQAEFERAAETAGVPREWATNPAMLKLVKNESGMRPTAKNPHSTAFGLFQFLSSTWRSYLPEVPYGSRDPYWQAVGGFRYIESRYRTPERAWAFWQATVNKDASMAPSDLRGLARTWISRGYAGY